MNTVAGVNNAPTKNSSGVIASNNMIQAGGKIIMGACGIAALAYLSPVLAVAALAIVVEGCSGSKSIPPLSSEASAALKSSLTEVVSTNLGIITPAIDISSVITITGQSKKKVPDPDSRNVPGLSYDYSATTALSTPNRYKEQSGIEKTLQCTAIDSIQCTRDRADTNIYDYTIVIRGLEIRNYVPEKTEPARKYIPEKTGPKRSVK